MAFDVTQILQLIKGSCMKWRHFLISIKIQRVHVSQDRWMPIRLYFSTFI